MNKQYKCAYCGCNTSIADFGERHIDGTMWCFEHTEKLWERLSARSNTKITNTSTYWDYLEKTTGSSPRPRQNT